MEEIEQKSLKKLHEMTLEELQELDFRNHDLIDELNQYPYYNVFTDDCEEERYKEYIEESSNGYGDLYEIKKSELYALQNHDGYVIVSDSEEELLEEYKVETLQEEIDRYVKNAPKVLDITEKSIEISFGRIGLYTNMDEYEEILLDLLEDAKGELENIDNVTDVQELDWYIKDLKDLKEIMEALEELRERL